ncbi:MAG: AAA family ATPase [Nocardioides sp.]
MPIDGNSASAGDPLTRSLSAALASSPDDQILRLHLAEVLYAQGRYAETIEHCSALVQRSTANRPALELLTRATSALSAVPESEPESGPESRPDSEPESRPDRSGPDRSGPDRSGPDRSEPRTDFDWSAAESDLETVIGPAFVTSDSAAAAPVVEDVETPSVTLADVGGMATVKRRLEVAFLGPMRNPEIARAYGKSLRGGLLLYGPPGCGKTFVARALAGELGARFFPVSLPDVLDMYLGQSERNLHQLFQTARAHTPCVLFFDEVDALGMRRSSLRGDSGIRTAVNQLLTELDSVSGNNDGVFVLAATNHPWEIDVALRRPGRFDRIAYVGPPDREARESIIRYHLQQRPIERIDLTAIVRATEGYSGADLAHLADSAAELALDDSLRSGQMRSIRMADIETALTETQPSTGAWFTTARNVAQFANEDGLYDELVADLKARKLM